MLRTQDQRQNATPMPAGGRCSAADVETALRRLALGLPAPRTDAAASRARVLLLLTGPVPR